MRVRTAVVLIALTTVAHASQDAAQWAGRWDATIVANGVEVPFRFDIAGTGAALKGSFFNGERRVTSTSSRVQDGALILNFDQYATKLQVTYRDGQLEGEYQRGARGNYPFHAVRFSPASKSAANPPSIDGTWI